MYSDTFPITHVRKLFRANEKKSSSIHTHIKTAALRVYRSFCNKFNNDAAVVFKRKARISFISNCER